MKTALALSAAVSCVLALSSPVHAAETPSATATFTGGEVAVGLGYAWGKGVLTYKGQTYPFKVKGLSVVGVGAEKVRGTAEVYNLKSVEDFPGVYGEAGAGGSFAKMGGGTAVMTNRHGVEIRLHTNNEGIDLNLAAGGAGISWAKPGM